MNILIYKNISVNTENYLALLQEYLGELQRGLSVAPTVQNPHAGYRQLGGLFLQCPKS